jgi:hypothetical protein
MLFIGHQQYLAKNPDGLSARLEQNVKYRRHQRNDRK